ncbi:hypothetical protein FO519_006225 [Halicephalobus sp. NKZ332]|nr:hypothetical protein FO519_006225 [Halicephalobus sp. NKZ332]
MSFSKDCKECFGSTDLYFILQISTSERENLTDAKVKKAYYKQSMLWHPDRFSDEKDEEKKANATRRFQIISKAYTILNDPEKRKLYDSTGIIDDEALLSFNEDWLATWKLIFKPITQQEIEKFLNKYLGSEDQKNDIINYYNKYKGDMDKILACVIGGDDEEQIRFMINDLIATGQIEPLPKYVNEPETKRRKREQKRQKESKEAEKEIQKLQKKSGKSKEEFDLFAAIQERQEKRKAESEAFFAHLVDKYGGKKNKRQAITSGDVDEKPSKRSRRGK